MIFDHGLHQDKGPFALLAIDIDGLLIDVKE